MKGINIQFDNLTNHLETSEKKQQILESLQNYEFVYQKVTMEALKIVSIIFDQVISDKTLQGSYEKFIKTLKTFILNKPMFQSQQSDQFFNQQFDELKVFMNNRKLIEIDNADRGDIYKYLSQAESKQKDMAQFMGNINKFTDNKRLLASAKKLNRTRKLLQAEKNHTSVQTQINMTKFQKLQRQFPSFLNNIIEQENKNSKENIQNNKQGHYNQQGIYSNEKSMKNLSIKQDNNKEDCSDQKKKQKQQEPEKLQLQKKKKLPNINNQNNSNNGKLKKGSLKRNSKNSQNGTNSINLPKNGKSGFQQNTSKNNNNENEFDSNSLNTIDNNQKNLNKLNVFENIKELNLNNLKQVFKGLSQEQIIQIYKTIHKKQNNEYQNEIKCAMVQTNKQEINMKDDNLQGYSNENSYKKETQESIYGQKKQIINKNKSTSINREGKDDRQNRYETDINQQMEKNVKFKDSNEEQNRFTKKISIQKSNQSSRKINTKQMDDQSNKSVIFKANLLRESLSEGKDHQDNSTNHNNVVQLSQSKRSILPFQNGIRKTNPNKQNYSLDMYKSKTQSLNSKLKTQSYNSRQKNSQHTNLPSIHRSKAVNNNTTNVKGSSSHQYSLENSQQCINGLKKSQMKNVHRNQEDSLGFGDTSTQNNKFSGKSNNSYGQSNLKKSRHSDQSKEEERIMKQLEKIVNENSIKKNAKNIKMYIQFIETVHRRNCGERCIHLERFNKFLESKNIPNRKLFSLHKADMNVNINL